MKNKKLKSGILTIVVLVGLIATNVLLNMQWLNVDQTFAFAITADEKTANDTPTVNDSTAQGASDTAMDANGNYVVVWQSFNQDGSGNGVYFRRFDTLGNVLTTGGNTNDVLVNSTTAGYQSDPSIAMDQDGNFVIAWAGAGTGDTQGIFMRAYLADGTALGPEQIVNSDTTDGQYLPAVAMDYNGSDDPGVSPNVVFTWYKYDAGFTDADTYMRRFGVDFGTSTITPMGTDIVVNTYTTGNQYEPSVAMNNFGEILVSWHGPGTGYTSDQRAWIQAYDNDGTVWGSNTLVSINAAGSRTDIAADKSSDSTLGGNFIITYDSTTSDDNDGGIFARLLQRCTNSGCDPASALEILVNTSTTGTQTFPSVAADGMGNFTVSWTDQAVDGDGYDVFAQNYKYNKSLPYGAVSRAGIQLRVNNAANQGSSAPNEQTEPSVAMSTDGFYTVTYKDYTTGNLNQADVKFQQFASEMMRNGEETLNNSIDGAGPISQTSTDVAVSNSGLTATVWVDQTDGGVKFTLRDSRNNNAVVGTAGTRVDNPSTTPNATPSVSFYKDTSTTSLGYGRFIIVWVGNGDGSDIYYREVDSAGNVLGSPAVLNQATTGAQVAPKVEAGLYSFNTPTDGTFTAMWVDENDGVIETYRYQGGTNEYIIFSCAFTLSCTNTSVDLNPVTGEALYAWDDIVTGADLYVQRASLGGPLIGAPIIVDYSYGAVQQYSPDVAFIKDGSQFVITYVNEDPTGNYVKAKVYNFSSGLDNDDFFISNCQGSCDDTNPKVASTTPGFTAGDTGTLFVWNTSGNNGYEINGALWRHNQTLDTFDRFSPNFRINSTQSADQFLPSVSMAGASNQMIVGWEGVWEEDPNVTGTTVDYEGSISQLLYNPIHA
jgi:hypothetical protein